MLSFIILLTSAYFFAFSDFNSNRNQFVDFLLTAFVLFIMFFVLKLKSRSLSYINLLHGTVILFVVVHGNHLNELYGKNTSFLIILSVLILSFFRLVNKVFLNRMRDKRTSRFDSIYSLKVYKVVGKYLRDSEKSRFLTYEILVWKSFFAGAFKLLVYNRNVSKLAIFALLTNISICLFLSFFSYIISIIIFLLNLYPIIWYSSVIYSEKSSGITPMGRRLIIQDSLRYLVICSLDKISSIDTKKVGDYNYLELSFKGDVKSISYFGTIRQVNKLCFKVDINNCIPEILSESAK